MSVLGARRCSDLVELVYQKERFFTIISVKAVVFRSISKVDCQIMPHNLSRYTFLFCELKFNKETRYNDAIFGFITLLLIKLAACS